MAKKGPGKSLREFALIEARLSDFHRMNLAVMKVFYYKQKLKVI